MNNDPTIAIPSDETRTGPEAGAALCLSGGGYRAMLFHVGVLWRLYETQLLQPMQRISSVSAGSIAAAVLALAWKRLSFDPAQLSTDFLALVVEPLRGMARESIDLESVALGTFIPGTTISDRITAAYDIQLFHGATLQDLPDEPRFVINAMNVQSGALWRFSKKAMRDYRVGEFKNPTVPLARAVAASSALPPMLSPCEIELRPGSVTPGSGTDLEHGDFIKRAVLTDGGVYDNMGLETAWKRYTTIFVSDAGAKPMPEGVPKSDWPRHAFRVLELIDNQVRSLRKRQIIEGFIAKERQGAYWGIRTNIADYGVADALPCPFDRTLALAGTPTRLKRMPEDVQERLINWGYAVCDAALRSHVNPALRAPTGFPYPNAGV